MSYLLNFLLVVANVLGAGMILPQVLRLHRLRSTEGVSPVGIGVGVAMNLWWIVYGTQAGAFGIVPVSAAGVALYSTIAWQYLRLDGVGSLSPMALGFAGIGIVPLIPYLFVGIETAGLTIGLLYGVQFSPAAIAAIRTVNPVGVSAATWTMAWIEAAIWAVYGSRVADLPLILGGAGGTFMASVILVRLVATQPRRPRTQRLALR